MAKNVTYLVSEAFTTIVEVNWSVNKFWHEWPPTLRDCVISFPLSWQRSLAPFCSSLCQFSHNHSKRRMLLIVSFSSADSLSRSSQWCCITAGNDHSGTGMKNGQIYRIYRANTEPLWSGRTTLNGESSFEVEVIDSVLIWQKVRKFWLKGTLVCRI